MKKMRTINIGNSSFNLSVIVLEDEDVIDKMDEVLGYIEDMTDKMEDKRMSEKELFREKSPVMSNFISKHLFNG